MHKDKEPLPNEGVDRENPEQNSNSLQAPSTQVKSDSLFIVGIGASAGGLEAFQALLPTLPSGVNFAYVIVQHLDPTHPSMLISLLQRYTTMLVKEVVDGQKPEADTICVTPPGHNVSMSNGRLRLAMPTSAIGPKPSIDLFFTSLAEDCGDKAVGIILSGTGSDGAHGIRAIKAEGGITIVQEAESARYAGMPEAAVGTGHVDMIRTPAKIGEELLSILEYPELLKVVEPEEKAPSDVNKILKMIMEQVGCDFSDYKTNTINRRVGRRMAVNKLTALADYIGYAAKTPGELELLVKDILISVTSFFRDAEAFKALEKALMEIIESKEDGDAIRIWVPGCSTGEEAYSIGILLAKILGERLKRFSIQIFGTDLDQEAIDRARKGIYPEATVVNVDRSILDRYFIRKENTVQVTERIREMIVFAKHDLIKDPPFAHLDLISCRNMLIYFNQSLQDRVVTTFHYVLNPGGFLFLGKSESITQFLNLFSPFSKKWRVFQSKHVLKSPVTTLRGRSTPVLGLSHPIHKQFSNQTLSAKETVKEAVIKYFGPASALIDDRMQALYFQGDTSPFLRPPEGEANLDILQMARSEIRLDLRTLIHRCSRDGVPGQSRPLSVKVDGAQKCFVIHVKPVEIRDAQKGLILVAFAEQEQQEDREKESRTGKDEDPRVYELEHELNDTRERLQTTIEELETTNEELMSLNEELQSSNEELQSSNEELETTSEELQSTNEELNTVNQELQVKSSELAAANNDLENIVAQIGLPLVIVDHDLKITRFNDAATSIFSLSAGDVGQVVTTVGTHLTLPALREKIRRVISDNILIDEDVGNSDRRFYMRIHPHVDRQNQPLGAMLIFVDKTLLLQKQKELETIGLISQLCLGTEDIESVYHELPALIRRYFNFPYVAVDLDQPDGIHTQGAVGLDYDENNPICVPTGETISGTVISRQKPLVRKSHEPLHPAHPLLKDLEVRTLLCIPLQLRERSIGALVVADSRAREDSDDLSKTLGVIGHHIALEIERNRVTHSLERQNETLQKIMDHIPVLVCFYDETGRFRLVNSEFERLLGWSRNDLKGMENPMAALYPDPEYRQEVWDYMMEAAPGWRDFRIHTKSGETLDSSWANVRLSDGSQIGIGIDIRERKQWEQDLEDSEERFRLMAESIDSVFWMSTPGFEKMLYVSPAYEKIWGQKPEVLYSNPQSFLDCVHPEDYERVTREVNDHAQEKRHFFYRIQRPDDTLRWIQDKRFPIHDEHGNLRFMVGKANDITEEKLAEQQLKQKNQELQEFSYVASHDLQEPLRKVKTFADILGKSYSSVLGEEGQDFIDRMISATSRMQDLLTALLEYSRIGWNQMTLGPVDLNEAVNKAISNLSILQEDTRGQVAVADLPSVEGDLIQLIQLFQNLVGNALKFSRKGQSPKVRITSQIVSLKTGRPVKHISPTSVCRIRVTDNGIGIDPEHSEKIFKPFERLHGRNQYGGTGMGLAICRRIVERHGGKISVRSTKEQGARFEFTLPFKQPERLH